MLRHVLDQPSLDRDDGPIGMPRNLNKATVVEIIKSYIISSPLSNVFPEKCSGPEIFNPS
jgi:hypothetical protein